MEAAEELLEEAICSICLDFFCAPVMLDCGHNFCRGCISLCWARAAPPACPQCREPAPGRGLRPNRPLGNIAERLRRLDRAGGAEGGLPGPPAHPLRRASVAEQIQSQLESLRREKGELEKQERKEWQICQDYVEKVKTLRQKIVPEFKQLRQYMEEQECQMLARLGELEKQIETRLKENSANFSKKIVYLDGLIKEKERQLPGHECLQDTGDDLSRCERAKLQQKEWTSHKLKKEPGICSEKAPALEEMARKLQDALTTATGEGVEVSWGPYTKVNVTLDPDTAQSRLILSEDQSSVMQGATQQSRPDNPERFDPWPCVLGCEVFDSGQLCWEVEVVCGSCWAVGLALASVNRKGPIVMSPLGGIWAVGQYKEKFQALTSPAPTPVLPSMVPRRVQICLDHAEGRVMFVNMDSKAVIFTFPQATFAGEKIHPWFWVGKGSQLKLS
ncbi:zinc finger protein RFP-like [Athene noctua]|uniref:zinc finger protein RFP-like n=1 Tax=Athene noctua TaxID=126797 RepID=UPI003EBE8386